MIHLRRTPSRVALCIASLSILAFGASVACSASAPDSTPPRTDAGARDALAEAAPVGPANDGGSDASTEPTRPPECTEVTPKLPRSTQQQVDSETYGFQPDIIADIQIGDAALEDRFRFYVDAAHPIGASPVSAAKVSAFYAFGNAGRINQDFVKDDGGTTGKYAKTFVSTGGTVLVTDAVTPYQIKGTLWNVRFDEVEAAADGTYKPVAKGACYWLKELAFDTRRAKGCRPFAKFDTCPAGTACMPTNAVGIDGTCVTTGAKTEGQTCVQGTGTRWDSDCAAGLRCIQYDTDEGRGPFCRKLCDVLSPTPGCPASMHCVGGYNTCATDAELAASSGIDPAPVGQPCATNAQAFYCGGTGLPGVCFDDDGPTGPGPATCRAWQTAASACPKLTGYASYKEAYADRSTLFCFEAK